MNVVNELFISHSKCNMSRLALPEFHSEFDAIDHYIVVHHLNTGLFFTDAVLQWYSSYLTDRTPYVSLSNYRFAIATVYSSVPQDPIFSFYFLHIPI